MSNLGHLRQSKEGTRSLRVLVLVPLLWILSWPAEACSVCFGGSGEPAVKGTVYSVLFLVVFTYTLLLAGAGWWFWRLRRARGRGVGD